jgi:hypothetical protein
MPPDREKRLLREQKREIKRKGAKVRRHRLKRDLADAPEEAHLSEPSVGRYRSADLNGLDRDMTRRRPDREG